MLTNNPPLPLDHTDEFRSDLRDWDGGYKIRARQCPTVVACTALFMELDNPPVITTSTMKAAFGRIPGTQTPPEIEPSEFQKLITILGLSPSLRSRPERIG
jgi:hypothetical protein